MDVTLDVSLMELPSGGDDEPLARARSLLDSRRAGKSCGTTHCCAPCAVAALCDRAVVIIPGGATHRAAESGGGKSNTVAFLHGEEKTATAGRWQRPY